MTTKQKNGKALNSWIHRMEHAFPANKLTNFENRLIFLQIQVNDSQKVSSDHFLNNKAPERYRKTKRIGIYLEYASS